MARYTRSDVEVVAKLLAGAMGVEYGRGDGLYFDYSGCMGGYMLYLDGYEILAGGRRRAADFVDAMRTALNVMSHANMRADGWGIARSVAD